MYIFKFVGFVLLDFLRSKFAKVVSIILLVCIGVLILTPISMFLLDRVYPNIPILRTMSEGMFEDWEFIPKEYSLFEYFNIQRYKSQFANDVSNALLNNGIILLVGAFVSMYVLVMPVVVVFCFFIVLIFLVLIVTILRDFLFNLDVIWDRIKFYFSEVNERANKRRNT